MYEKVYAKGSRPYLADASLSEIKIGDTIQLFNPTNPRWGTHHKFKVESLNAQGVQYEGAWYLESDGWEIQREVTPKTIEVIEPFENNWMEYHSYPNRRLRVVRTVEEAAQMIHCEALSRYSHITVDTTKLHAFARHINWTEFSRIAKKLGVDFMLDLAEPFYQMAVAKVEGKNYYNQTDKSHDLESNLVLPYPYSFQRLRYSTEINMTYWVLSFALGVGEFDATDIAKIIDTLGIDNYLYYVNQKKKVDELLHLADEITHNDIDLALFSTLNG